MRKGVSSRNEVEMLRANLQPLALLFQNLTPELPSSEVPLAVRYLDKGHARGKV
jgi:hypothetical protein